MRKDILEKEELIKNWIKENKSKAFICKQLKCKPDTLNSYLIKMNISYNGNQGRKGRNGSPNKLTLEQYLLTENPKTHQIRLKILEENIKEHKCEICGNSEWNGEPIPLELHHINGDRYNNILENFLILCPNCHAQTDNYCKRKNTQVVER